MKPILLILLASLAIAGLSFCQSTRYTADQLPAKQIRWGSGGGFTGIESGYILLENGQLFKKEKNDGALTELPKAKRKTAENLFERCFTDQLLRMEYMKPRNTYYYLELADGNMVNRMSWAGEDGPEEALQLCKELNALLPAE